MTDTYNATLVKFAQGDIDWVNDTIKVALVSDATPYTPDIDNEEFVDDVLDGGTTAQEFNGTGYTSPSDRQTLTGRTVDQNNTDDRAEMDCDDTTVFPNVDGDTAQGALIYKEVGGDGSTAGDDPLIGYYDGGSFPQQAGGGDLTVEWPTPGVYYLTN